MARFAVLVSLLALIVVTLPAQTSPVSDPQAVSLATKSMAALTGGNPVSDISLTGSVTWIAGSDYLTGTGTLQAKGAAESRIDLSLGGTTRSEIRSAPGGVPQGAWAKGAATAASPALQPFAQHNCWTDAAWFFPALSSLAQSSKVNFIFSYVGLEQHGGINAQHVRVSQVFAQDTKNAVFRLSTMEFYLDPASGLPLAIAFQVHADNDLNTDIPMEIRFANYQAVNGVLVPFHIQRIFNGGVALDIVVTSAAINSGLLDNNFNIQ